ncbi:unnamed protein product, partial [Didymodactylos carnosus]
MLRSNDLDSMTVYRGQSMTAGELQNLT